MLLPGDGDTAAGGVDKENANRKTVSEILSLNPMTVMYFLLLLLFETQCLAA